MKLDGIVPIIPTPFNVEEQIDWRTMRQLLEFAGSVAVSAVCLPAYASEFYKLSNDERCELIALAVKHLDGRVPVIAQANSVSAAHAVELARFAQDAGAAAVAIAVPRQFAVRAAICLVILTVSCARSMFRCSCRTSTPVGLR